MQETKTFFDSDINAVVWEINGFVKPDEFKKIGSESHKLRKKYAVNKQLNNVKNMKVLTSDIQNWINNDWFPAAKETELKHFAFVVPEDIFGKASMEIVNVEAKEKFGVTIEYFSNENSAKKWLKSI